MGRHGNFTILAVDLEAQLMLAQDWPTPSAIFAGQRE